MSQELEGPDSCHTYFSIASNSLILISVFLRRLGIDHQKCGVSDVIEVCVESNLEDPRHIRLERLLIVNEVLDDISEDI